MDRRTIILLGLCTACMASAEAAEWQRCRLPDGSIAYQPRACPEPAQALGSLDVDETAPTPPARGAQATDRRWIEDWERRSRARLAPSLGGSSRTGAPPRAGAPPPPARETACDAARRTRDQAYARDGNRMGFDQRRALLDAVNQACGLR